MGIKDTLLINALVLAPYGAIMSTAREFKDAKAHWQDGVSCCLLLCAVAAIETIKLPGLSIATANGWVTPELAAAAYLGTNAAEKLALSFIFRRSSVV